MKNYRINENTELGSKYNQLLKFIKGLGKVAIAFSGGVDSTFLAKACKDTLGDNVMALTVISPYIQKWEIDEAIECTKELKIKHKFINVDIIDDIKNNPSNRCYLCKKHIFKMIKENAMETGFINIVDGTNYDDLDDYRPGLKVLDELNIISPLVECKIKKKDVRLLSKKLNLKTWDKPAYACLLTRLPHDTKIEIETLTKIEKAEKYLIDINIRAVRVRVHGDVARIEVDPKSRELFFDTNILDSVSKAFKDIGFKYVALDLEGYKMGNFNQL